MKLIKDLGNNQFIIEALPDKKGKYRDGKISIAHDYVAIKSHSYFQNENNSISSIPYSSSIQLPIRSWIQVILPLLNNHKYLQQDHIKDREHDSDDAYFEQYKLDKPRWKKGDLYPGYSYQNQVIEYYDKDKECYMVAVLEVDQKVFNHVTLEFFNKYIKDNLKY